MGYVLAATDNDAYNALVCTRFSSEFNRNAVFQIPMPTADEDEKKGITATLRGQRAFSDNALYTKIYCSATLKDRGFKKTKLTDEYTFEMYLEKNDGRLFATLVVRESGGLQFDLDRYKPSAGDTVINFLPQTE